MLFPASGSLLSPWLVALRHSGLCFIIIASPTLLPPPLPYKDPFDYTGPSKIVTPSNILNLITPEKSLLLCKGTYFRVSKGFRCGHPLGPGVFVSHQP